MTPMKLENHEFYSKLPASFSLHFDFISFESELFQHWNLQFVQMFSSKQWMLINENKFMLKFNVNSNQVDNLKSSKALNFNNEK